MIGLSPGGINRIVLLGAHCDDIAIGAGGALLTICSAHPGTQVDALVLAGGGTDREDEEHAALTAFCPGADLRLTVLKLPDGRLPAHWDEAKDALQDLRARTDPDLLFAPHPGDAHQDHRGLAKLVPTAFRDHLTLGYEIVKWDGDLARPSVYQPLAPGVAEAKVSLLQQHYPSQRHRPLVRPRGVPRARPDPRHRMPGALRRGVPRHKLTLDLAGG